MVHVQSKRVHTLGILLILFPKLTHTLRVIFLLLWKTNPSTQKTLSNFNHRKDTICKNQLYWMFIKSVWLFAWSSLKISSVIIYTLIFIKDHQYLKLITTIIPSYLLPTHPPNHRPTDRPTHRPTHLPTHLKHFGSG